MEKKFVYVLLAVCHTEECDNDFCRVYANKDKAIADFKEYVKAEKESDFVQGHPDYETFADFVDADNDTALNGFLALYDFGDQGGGKRGNCTVVQVQKVRVIE